MIRTKPSETSFSPTLRGSLLTGPTYSSYSVNSGLARDEPTNGIGDRPPSRESAPAVDKSSRACTEGTFSPDERDGAVNSARVATWVLSGTSTGIDLTCSSTCEVRVVRADTTRCSVWTLLGAPSDPIGSIPH